MYTQILIHGTADWVEQMQDLLPQETRNQLKNHQYTGIKQLILI